MVDRRIKKARFPAVKSFDTFDFTAIPTLNKMLVLELACSGFILRRENVIASGYSGTGKTHVALALGLAACQKGFTVAFTTAAALVHQLMEARDERRLLKLQRDRNRLICRSSMSGDSYRLKQSSGWRRSSALAKVTHSAWWDTCHRDCRTGAARPD